MSRKNRPSPSVRGDLNVPTTERTAQPPEEPNAPSVETTMEASVETTEPSTAAPIEASSPVEQTGPTAKEMARVEEENAARAAALAKAADFEPPPEAPPLIELAAQGMDALHDALRAHRDTPQAPEYTPPPLTERQRTRLEEELAAGARAVERAQAQLANRPPPERDPNEGVTNPVHRPSNMVPDPMTGRLGAITG